jgi:probable rRNA maturation factor
MKQSSFYGFNAASLPLLEKALEATIKAVRKKSYNITFVLISDAEIKKLNTKFRKTRRITDVISFLVEPENLTGDIYIAKARSQKQAKKYGHSWNMELAYLVIHGVLHLCGYSDYDPDNKKMMFDIQDRIFKCLY